MCLGSMCNQHMINNGGDWLRTERWFTVKAQDFRDLSARPNVFLQLRRWIAGWASLNYSLKCSSQLIKSLLSQLLSPNRNAKFTTHLKLATLKSKFWERGWKISSTSWCFSMDESQWNSKFDLVTSTFPNLLWKLQSCCQQSWKNKVLQKDCSLPLVDIPSGR